MVFLEISQNSQENTCVRVSWNFIKKETLCIFTEHLRTTASDNMKIRRLLLTHFSPDDWILYKTQHFLKSAC